MPIRLTVNGNVQGIVVGNGRVVTNTFVDGQLVSSIVDGRDDAERQRRYDLLIRHGVETDLAEWYANLAPGNESAARKALREYNIGWED